jgi:hypothetical protein
MTDTISGKCFTLVKSSSEIYSGDLKTGHSKSVTLLLPETIARNGIVLRLSGRMAAAIDTLVRQFICPDFKWFGF